MRSNIGDETRIGHMLDAVALIETFINGRTRDSLDEDMMFRSALERQLEIIGEASSHVTQNLKDEYSHIAWHQIKRFRHIVAHEYFGVNQNAVWNIATIEIPLLKSSLQEIQRDKNFRT